MSKANDVYFDFFPCKELIYTLERRYGLAFVFVQCSANNCSVFDIYLRFGVIMLECKCMLHPVLVVTLRKKAERTLKGFILRCQARVYY
jgi:hypothetical protein